MAARSQTTLQITSAMALAAADRRWIMMAIATDLWMPYHWTPSGGPDRGKGIATIVCWPATEAIRRHLLGMHVDDVIAIRGELAIYEGKHTSHQDASPRQYLGAKIDHVFLVARARASAKAK